ncbi:MAG: hypothetical protein IJ099_01055 [Alphaproteobacteria bacterium]|nr:hypothetical protein [Alphaproteobacteria bacterium]
MAEYIEYVILNVSSVATQTGIPAKVIESMELGRSMRYGALTNLFEFYGKTELE